MWIYHILFIHSSVDGHLYQLLKYHCWVIWSTYILTFWRTATLFFQRVHHFTFPPQQWIRVPIYPHWHCPFNYNHPSMEVSHLMALGIFSCAYWPFVYLLCRDAYSGPLPIFYLGYLLFYYWVVRVLYIHYTQDPDQTYDLQVFSVITVLHSLNFGEITVLHSLNFGEKAQYIHLFQNGIGDLITNNRTPEVSQNICKFY